MFLQGSHWWGKKGRLGYSRPFLVEFYNCTTVTVKQVTLRNAMFWTLHPVYCDSVNIEQVVIRNPLLIAPNTDGIDPDSSSNVRIANCQIYTGYVMHAWWTCEWWTFVCYTNGGYVCDMHGGYICL